MASVRAHRQIYLGLGSNLGGRWSYLAMAVDILRALDESLVCSSIYESAPQGGPTGQGRFLNCAVGLHSDLDARELLGFCQQIEARAKRVRGQRWGPRTLDVDILFIEGEQIDSEELTVPHREIFNRSFVLAPLAELGASFVPRNWDVAHDEDQTGPLALRSVGDLVRSPVADRRARLARVQPA